MVKTNQFAQFYGNMDWFDVDDDTDDLIFPLAFEQAKALWEVDPLNHYDKIISLLAPYVRAWFVPSGISNSEELFKNPEDLDLWEKYGLATKINVVGLDFSTSPFPKCRAEAWFSVPVTDNFSTINLEQWLEDHGECLYQAISFGWEIPAEDVSDSSVFTWANHEGIEGVLLD